MSEVEGLMSLMEAASDYALENQMSEERVSYKLYQDGLFCAGVDAKPKDARRLMQEYIAAYEQDGPVSVGHRRKVIYTTDGGWKNE